MPGLTPFAIHSVRIRKGYEIPADDDTVNFEWSSKKEAIASESVNIHIDVDLED